MNNRSMLTGTGCILALLMCGTGAMAELEIFVEEATTPAASVPAGATEAIGETSANTSGATSDVLEFMNADKLRGTLESLDPKGYGLRWRHPSAAKPIDFSIAPLSTIKLKKRLSGKYQSHSTTVRLTNGDTLMGEVASMTEDKLVIDTWYAGKVSIERPMVKMISPGSASSVVVYAGPKSLSEWTFRERNNKPTWKYNKGSIYGYQSYPAAQYIEDLPDLCDFQFDVAWKSYISFYFAFYTDNLQSYSGNSYVLSFSSSSVHLSGYSRNMGSRSLGSANIQKFNQGGKTKARINVLVDKKKKSFSLLVDGQMVRQWTDSQGFAGMGNGILFQPQSNYGLKISNITISKWDGVIADSGETVEDVDEDTIRFMNNDKISGQLTQITRGEVKFKTSYATLDIPYERVVEIRMSDVDSERARRNKGDAKAQFKDHGEVTLQINSIENGKLNGESENFGQIVLPIDALSQIDFNIYNKQKEDDSDNEEEFDFF